MCIHLKKLRKLIKNKSLELDDYDRGEDLVRNEKLRVDDFQIKLYIFFADVLALTGYWLTEKKN